jgi:hypothetical protein
MRLVNIHDVLYLWHRIRLFLKDFDRISPILIYQMGKVGSSAVYKSLKAGGIPNPIYHVHFLSHRNLDEVEQFYRNAGALKPLSSLKFWRSLRKKLDRGRKPVYLISLVREPIAREISDVFQNMAAHHPQLLSESGDVDIEKTVDFISTEFAGFDEATDYTCTWFNKEMLDSFGLDVYATPFDHQRGYSIIANDRANLLLLRMEDLSTIFETATEDFLGQSIPLRVANEASSKSNYQAYQRVLGQLSLPGPNAARIYNSRYAKHFYPSETRQKLTKHWQSDSQRNEN